MSYKRNWTNPRNAVGFAAECARLALSFYDAGRKPDLVAAIEIAEQYSRGEKIDRVAAADAAAYAGRAAAAAAYAATAHAATYATCAAAYAARSTARATAHAIYAADVADAAAYAAVNAVDAAVNAAAAGVSEHILEALFTRWIIKDQVKERTNPMKITQVTYSRLQKTAMYENERIEASVAVEEGDDPAAALTKARAFVFRELGIAPTKEEYKKAKETIASYEAD